MLEHQIGPATQDPRTFLGEGPPPARIGVSRRVDRAPGLVGSHAGHTRKLASRGRVDVRQGSARVRLDPGPADVALLEQEPFSPQGCDLLRRLCRDLRHDARFYAGAISGSSFA